MKTRLAAATLLTAAALLAQGPPPGGPGFGPGGPGGPGFGMPPGPPPATVTGAPYSGVETAQSVQTLSDGTQITHNETITVYRDSEGRTRTERTMTTPSGSSRTDVTIVDPVAGYVTHLDASRSTAVRSTLPIPPSGTPPAPPPGAPTPQVTDLGSKTINGLPATGTRTTLTIPAGTFGNSQAITSTREVWTSTDLQIPLSVTATDPRFGTSTRQLGTITRTEPDATLFQVPSSYTVTTRTRPDRP